MVCRKFSTYFAREGQEAWKEFLGCGVMGGVSLGLNELGVERMKENIERIEIQAWQGRRLGDHPTLDEQESTFIKFELRETVLSVENLRSSNRRSDEAITV